VDRREPLAALEGHAANALMVTWAPEGLILGSAGMDHKARIWDVERGKQIGVIGHTAHVLTASFLNDARVLATKGRDACVRLTCTNTWKELAALEESNTQDGWAVGLAFHPSLPLLATLGSEDREVRVWDLDLALLLSGAEDPDRL
jgi:WD40 repeat protein